MAPEPSPAPRDLVARLRGAVRASELAIVPLAALVGVAAGLVVIAMGWATQALHEIIFGISPQGHLSLTPGIAPALIVLGPAVGGLVFGLVSAWVTRRVARQPVDPIEANALHGGRMSLTDSLVVAVQTLFSSGVGASVGLEAGYTQAASGIASRFGQMLHLRRADLRMMVGCASGAAIGAAFNAPLMGAFYGFELILGTYAIPAFIPMMTASFTAALTRQFLVPDINPPLPSLGAASLGDLPLVLLLGLISALVGIAVMRIATLTEGAFRSSAIPACVRPAIGGLAVGLLALGVVGVGSPVVLSAGHGAVYHYIVADGLLWQLALLLAAKVLASSVSIGSGFRGGLFFASLLMGVLAGRVFAGVLVLVFPGLGDAHALYALIGMSAVAVAVVGGPMTMTLLALEMTGDLGPTLAVLGAAGIASLVTRRLFGFSFATWRFHLRGENIRGAHDIGWLRELKVRDMMRLNAPQLDLETPLAIACRTFPPGSTRYLVATQGEDRYAGMVVPAALYAQAQEGGEKDGESTGPATLADILRYTDRVLYPDTTIREALDQLEAAEADALAVVASPSDRTLVGVLSERRAIRRYSEELTRRMNDITGDRTG